LQVVLVVLEEVFGEDHAGGPELASAALGEVFVELERGGEEAAEVEGGGCGGFVGGGLD